MLRKREMNLFPYHFHPLSLSEMNKELKLSSKVSFEEKKNKVSTKQNKENKKKVS